MPAGEVPHKVRDTRVMVPSCQDPAVPHKDGRLVVLSRTHLRFRLDGNDVGREPIDRGRVKGWPYKRERSEVGINGALKGTWN